MSMLAPVLHLAGLLLLILSGLMLLPAAADALARHRDVWAFLIGAGVTAAVGGLLRWRWPDPVEDLTTRQVFLFTGGSWIIVALFAALPFWLSDAVADSGAPGLANALFEAMSGLTTTGATVLTGLDHMPPGILLWRALLHGLGGVGIVVMAVTVLPALRVGGMQLFHSESSDRSDKLLPRARQIAKAMLAMFGALTAACAAAYLLAGMSPFDAVTHALSTISTGGFGNYDASIGHFKSPAIEWIATLFMAAGGAPFVLLIRAARGDGGALGRSEELRLYLGVLLGAGCVLAAWMLAVGVSDDLHRALRLALFHVVSIVTTTGFVAADYGAWGGFAVTLFFVLTAVGGCTGSTAGGIKIFRLQALRAMLSAQARHLIYPRGVFARMVEGRPLTDEVAASIAAFIFAFGLSFVVITLLLGLLGWDLVTAASAAATALANVGPGLGPVVGPCCSFQPLDDAAKLVLTIGMLLGRLEFFTLVVLLSRTFWRD